MDIGGICRVGDDRLCILSLGTELKSAVSAAGKRKGTDTLSDGPACKRPALLATQFVVSISLFSSELSAPCNHSWDGAAAKGSYFRCS